MKNIEITNYRCFRSLSLSFKEGVNLFIGDNSSGKTTLLRAISSVLNSFFVGFSDEHTRFIGLSKDDFTITIAETGLANEAEIKIDFQMLGEEASLQLLSKKGRTLKDPLKPIKEKGEGMYKNLFLQGKQVLSLPLFASFSTSDIHSVRKLTYEPFKQYEHKPSFGYYECLQGDGFLNYWTRRLLVLREANTGELEVQGVLKGLLDTLGINGCNVIKDIHIRPLQGQIYYYLSDDRLTNTDNLSDGLRRLVNVVMDIAFRCMLLNKGIYGLEACKKTEGTVLIDEIDLHLHPTLQVLVLKGLKNAFPRLQFIITTHAPMVMTGISNEDCNIIYKLLYTPKEGYKAIPMQLYGLDASSIIEIALNIPSRSKEVDEQLKNLFDLIDEDEYEKALKILQNMREKFGDNLPELAKAEAMLNFFTNDNS
jgi:predicted ATP-binding protein involved in virulence